jgi:hypothetical protein
MSGAQAGASTNSLLSEIAEDAAAKIYRIVRCTPDCPVSQQRPRQRWAAQLVRNQRATRGPSQRSPGRTVLSDVPLGYPVCQGDHGCNGRLRQTRKEIMHCSCPVVHRNVQCAHG